MLIPIAIFVYLASKAELIRVAQQHWMESMAKQVGQNFPGGFPGFGGFTGFPGGANAGRTNSHEEAAEYTVHDAPVAEGATDHAGEGATSHGSASGTSTTGPRDFVQDGDTVRPDQAPQRQAQPPADGPEVITREARFGPFRGSVRIIRRK